MLDLSASGWLGADGGQILEKFDIDSRQGGSELGEMIKFLPPRTIDGEGRDGDMLNRRKPFSSRRTISNWSGDSVQPHHRPAQTIAEPVGVLVES